MISKAISKSVSLSAKALPPTSRQFCPWHIEIIFLFLDNCIGIAGNVMGAFIKYHEMIVVFDETI